MANIGEFFAVDRRSWAKVCDAGMNPAVAYLVLARFSGRDNLTTGAAAEIPPVERIRQTQDVMTLRLLIDASWACLVPVPQGGVINSGGVSPWCTFPNAGKTLTMINPFRSGVLAIDDLDG